jgi:hypothetical protein
MLVALELLVRIFHLQDERPMRYADDKNVEKWIPNQTGYSVTGNRRQNVGKYQINNFGFNSVYENYSPTANTAEIALIGDSFFEGFHEDYTHSLGQQIEKQLKATTVLEFGYAGYDLADELHLMNAYKDLFNQIDHSFIYLRCASDLDRDAYELSFRLSLETPLRRITKHIKLLGYLNNIGALSSLTGLPKRINDFFTNNLVSTALNEAGKLPTEITTSDEQKLENLKKLLATYPIDKQKATFVLNTYICSPIILSYLKKNDYKILDLSEAWKGPKPTTLIYDQHWNKKDRALVVELIVEYMKKNKL